MKKIGILLITACLCFTMLCSCTPSPEMPDHLIPSTPSSGNTDSGVMLECPPAYGSYTFHTRQEVLEALTQKDSNAYALLREEQIHCGAVYQYTLSQFASGAIKVAVPQLNKSPMPLRNRDGFPNVTLLTSETYYMPWIWYHCNVNNQNVRVHIAYLDSIEEFEVEPDDTYRDILKTLAPSAPTPETYQNSDHYKIIYEKTLELGDGVTTTAMVSEFNDRPNLDIKFRYDDLLIIVVGEESLLTDEFWKSFGIAYL